MKIKTTNKVTLDFDISLNKLEEQRIELKEQKDSYNKNIDIIQEELSNKLSLYDSYTQELHHLIELNNFSETNIIKIYKELNNVLIERRKVKWNLMGLNAIRNGTILKKVLDRSYIYENDFCKEMIKKSRSHDINLEEIE